MCPKFLSKTIWGKYERRNWERSEKRTRRGPTEHANYQEATLHGNEEGENEKTKRKNHICSREDLLLGRGHELDRGDRKNIGSPLRQSFSSGTGISHVTEGKNSRRLPEIIKGNTIKVHKKKSSAREGKLDRGGPFPRLFEPL